MLNVPVPPQYAVTGTVTKNGSTPPVTGCYPGYTRAELQFDHLADARYSSTTTVGNCSSASDPFTVSTSLYPGTYRVTVRRGSFGSASGLPAWDTVVTSSFVVSAASSGNVFEVPVPPQYAVTGIVTKNGSTPPVTGCYPGYTRAELQFDHLADARYSSTTTVGNCTAASDPFTVSTSLYPGTYRVTVRRGSFGSASGLPSWDTVVSSNFVVSATSSGNVFEVPVPPQYAVSGIVTKNGATPAVTGCYPGYTRAELQFDHLADARYSSTATVGNCTAASDPFTVNTSLYPGTYRVTVRRGSFGSASGLPSWDTVVNSSFVVSAASSGNAFDVAVPPQYLVSGTVTKNGATPPVTGCYPGYTRAELQFDHLADARYSSSTTVGNCTSASDPFTFTTNLYPGTYRVTVRRGSFGSASGLPAWDTVVVDRLAIP